MLKSKGHHSRINLGSLYSDFECSSETELYNKLIEESKRIPCVACGKEYDFMRLLFIDGDPFCSNCANGG
jgi:hypothetical protein